MSERKKWNVEARFKVSTLSTNTVCMVNAMKRLRYFQEEDLRTS